MYSKFVEEQIKAGATLVIEDPEQHFGFTQAPNILILNTLLTDAEFRVYMAIKSFAYAPKMHCWPGQNTIGQLTKKSRVQINRIINELERKKLLHIVRRGLRRSNIYILKKIPMEYVEKYQKLIKETGVEKPANPVKSTNVSKMIHQDVSPVLHEEDITINVVVVAREIMDKIVKATGEKIPLWTIESFIKKYGRERVEAAIEEMDRQIQRGVEIKGIGAWLRAAIKKKYEPDKPAKVVRKFFSKDGRGGQKKEAMSEEEKRKRELIKSLYLS